MSEIPQLLIINGEHVGVFTTSDAAKKNAHAKWRGHSYQIVDISLFYATDFGDKREVEKC